MTATWLTGPALDVARTLPAASVDLIASSPPFLALRDYNGVEGQWGSEPTPAAFLDNLLELATELRRVLAPHGSIAVELGDTYSGSGGGGGDYLPGGMRDGQVAFSGSARAHNAAHWRAKQVAKSEWPPAKSLTGTPTLFAWSLAYGRNLLNPAHAFEPWLVRNVIVWARNNPPVGALGDKVRPATSYITVACPSPRRWFDLDAVRQPSDNTRYQPTNGAKNRVRAGHSIPADGHGLGFAERSVNPAGAPPLDHWHDEYDGDHTWLINTQGSSLAHYAMWPSRLAERLVLAMCPREVCRTCGEPRRRITEQTDAYRAHRQRSSEAGTNMRAERVALGMGHGGRGSERMAAQLVTVGWSDCGHDNYRPGVTLDPFSGTGTTIHAAEVRGRDGIGIDLDPINATLRDRRRDEVRRNLLDVAPEVPGQLTLEALL